MSGRGIQPAAKRLFDVAASLLLLALCLPLLLTAAALVKLTSPGPVLFLQERPGLGGRVFRIYKLRTMRTGSERMVKGQEVGRDDPRVTPAGRLLRRTKVDELPQLLNVLKGDMSLVGPRPERLASLEDYDAETARRLDMLPGMTGLAQVSGNICLPLEERYRLDVYYVDHFSLSLDIRILLRTVGVVLLGEGRYAGRPLVHTGEGAGQSGARHPGP